MPFFSSTFRQTAKSAVLAACGLPRLARRCLAGQGVVLTFHGLCAGQAQGVLDDSLHLPVSVFQKVCAHLAAHYRVMPLGEMVSLWQAGRALPPGAVAITFDDGLGSNYHLGFPVLKALGLPATVFLATGFLDGTHPLWFQEVDRVFQARGLGRDALFAELARLKALPDARMREEVAVLTSTPLPPPAEVMRPMTWDQAREMQAGGLVSFGGHTHRHPVLARCDAAQQEVEILLCRDRMEAELGVRPTLFAYTNGGPCDFTEETQVLLSRHGFEAAFTMMPGRLVPGLRAMALPRYGNPTTVVEAEATVSGAFELLRQWRGRSRA